MKCTKCGYEWQDETSVVCPSCETLLDVTAGEDVYQRGVHAEREGKYKTAMRFYAVAADNGEPCAAYAVCRTLEKSGVRRENPDLYEFWLFTAARHDPIAALAYANYLDRLGDEHASFRYLHAAADMGHAGAMLRLGRYYLRHGNRPVARYYFARCGNGLRARIYRFLAGRSKPQKAPVPPEMPDRTVEAYTIGTFAMTLGVPHIAYGYFEEAAAASYLPALERVAEMCMRGTGCARNEQKVESCLLELAESGRSDAYIRLGDYFVSGALGGTPNPHAAFDYYLRAAEAGNVRAMVTVGDCLYDGDGRDKDIPRALAWYDRAAGAGDDIGTQRAARMRDEAERLREDGVKALEAGETEVAMEAFRLSAVYGNVHAICAMGDVLLAGKGIKAEPKKAAKLYERAAELGDARAKYRLANLYLLNHGVRADRDKAKALLEEALAGGVTSAAAKLEDMKVQRQAYLANRLYVVSCAVYHRGEHTEAAALRAAAARMSHPRATFYLACMYDCGDGVERNKEKAVALYERAAMLGYDGRTNGALGKYLHRLPR